MASMSKNHNSNNIVINNNIGYGGSHSDSGGFLIGLLFIIGTLAFVEMWKPIMVGAVAGGTAYLVIRFWQRMKRNDERRQAERDAMASRADLENRDYLSGGIYEGGYPAVTMPIDDVYYDDNETYKFDDGMHEWA
jgi:hypothetical protein